MIISFLDGSPFFWVDRFDFPSFPKILLRPYFVKIFLRALSSNLVILAPKAPLENFYVCQPKMDLIRENLATRTEEKRSPSSSR